MKTLIGCCAALALSLAGCGSTPKSGPPPTGPLTVVQWQTLAVEQKYAPETFERLKLGDPSLQDPQEWEKFFVTVIATNRKRDIPFDPGPKR